MNYVDMAEKIKERHKELSLGDCRVLSQGHNCECTLCLADNLRRLIKEHEERETEYIQTIQTVRDHCLKHFKNCTCLGLADRALALRKKW